MTIYNISLQHIFYSLPDGKKLFHDLSADFNFIKTGLVGSNGVGKSTLLKLISGELLPESGTIAKNGSISVLPQSHVQFDEMMISDVLGITQKLKALRNISDGKGRTEDFNFLADDWEIESRFSEMMTKAKLSHLNAERKMQSLSGGEKSRILFLSEILKNPDFLLLDEPTNHLDSDSRNSFYELIKGWKKGLLVISHDRELLRLMDSIYELSPNGMKFFGGNYDFFSEQKKSEEQSAQSQFLAAKKELKKDQKHIRSEMEKLNKRKTQSRKSAINTGVSNMMRGIMQRSGENSAGKRKDIFDDRIEKLQNLVYETKSRLTENHRIQIDLEDSVIPKKKMVLSVRNLNYQFENGDRLWKENLNFEIFGPERISISGKNGSGKSMLCKLIAGELKTDQGEITVGIQKISMLDQSVSFLQNEFTILENITLFSESKLPEHELRIRLGRFLFYNDSVFKKCGNLSGGERIRAGLACLLASGNAPELLILDEPTNNLDFASIEELTTSLSNFKGALIVISHDQDFLGEIKISKRLDLEELYI